MELFKLLGTIAIDTDKANEAIDETTNKAKDSEGKQSSAFKKIGGAAVAGAKVIAGAAAAVGGAWIGAIEGTREYRVSMGNRGIVRKRHTRPIQHLILYWAIQMLPLKRQAIWRS